MHVACSKKLVLYKQGHKNEFEKMAPNQQNGAKFENIKTLPNDNIVGHK